MALRLGSTVRHSDPARSSSTNTYASRFFGSLILVGMVSALTYGISRLGYLASDAALLLMGLRPAGRAYEYLVERLSSIGREVRFPRDDVFALRSRIDDLETQVKA